MILRIALAAVLFLHGIVHVIGFLVPWQLMTNPEFEYTTSAAWGTLELGDGGTRLVGLVMLALAVAFAVAALGVLRRASWALSLTVGVTLVSLAACILQSPAAILGVALDLVILAVAGLSRLRAATLQPTIAR
ncbi:MAG: hypothetical protein A2V85_06995 [Chloroflexi bacterium RBG_16_72_14]|nr:MAG: hypothetical protein A2V85_06995 [Chloroflexi bacterium RBG_16_72_14]